jgi:hypothetical protein
MTQTSQTPHTNFDFGNFSEACNIFVPRAGNAQRNAFVPHSQLQQDDFSQKHELATPSAF